MQKILVISDPHITVAGKTIIGLDPLARFMTVLHAACRDHPDARALILLGDLTHRGLPEEYARLAQALSDCPLPVIPMLGNHDRREVFQGVFPDAPRCAAGFVQTIVDLPDHRIITLDTLDGPPYPDRHHSGRLCEARLDFLTDALATCEGRQPLVFMHHPPFRTGIVGMDTIRLADGDHVLSLLAEYPGVHLLCGHIHRPISGTTSGVPWTVFKSTCHQGPIDLIKDDSSLSIDEPGAYGLILLAPQTVIVHAQDVMTTAPIVEEDEGSASAQ